MNLNRPVRSEGASPAPAGAFVSLALKKVAMRPLVHLIIWSSREGVE